ncbi:MAG: ABC transporter ATP-binding protein [Desulfomonile sp.]|nr:ABC transporter ATP-binding protein [Desulfomonile sp.]
MSDPVIIMEDLSFSYDGHLVLEDVNLAIHEQELVSFVGPNGGGKTTLLKLMLGLLHPTKGTVRIFGKRPQDARPLIGYMPQHAHLDPQFPVSVMDVVLMGRLGLTRPFGPYTKADRIAAEEALRTLHVWDLRRKHFSALSGGQRQRVLIARALAPNPRLLLLDEPTAGLDVAIEGEFYELIRGFARKMTVVLVSHDLGFVSQLVHKVVCVKRSVVTHATSDITGEIISRVYGSEMKMVLHDRSNGGDIFKCITS